MQRLVKYVFIIFSYLIILQKPITAQTTNDQGLFFLPVGTDKAFVAPVLKTTVEVEVEGVFVTTVVRQHFLNPTKDWLEAVYLFPLPEKSIIDRLRMKVGNRFIEGKIEEKFKAEKIYNEAKNKGQKTSLVAKTKSNIFRTNVANIGPGEQVSIEIKYQDRILLKDGEYIFRLPTVIAPRYIDQRTFDQSFFEESINIANGKPTFASPIRDPDLPTINPYTLTVDLKPGFVVGEVAGLYHDIDVIHVTPKYKKVFLTEKDMASTRDFVLTWKPKTSDAPQVGLFIQKWKGDTYLLANMYPPTNKNNYVEDSIPRDLILVIDKSGSMSGTSMKQLKKSLNELLNMIDDTTRIKIIAFHDNNEVLFSEPRNANEEVKKLAKFFIKNLEADKGTNMFPAIDEALDTPDTEGRLTQVVVLTDGNIENPEFMLSLIEKDLGKKRLFMVGIGSAPNNFVIKEASKLGKGTYLHIGKINETKTKMVSLFNKLQYPAILDLKIDYGEISNIEQFPVNLPDLYYGEPFTAVMKILDKGIFDLPKKINISGKFNGKHWEHFINKSDIQFSKIIHKIYASDKINNVKLRYRQGKIHENSMEDEIRKLGMDYQMVTKYTSLVAVDLHKSRPEHKDISFYQIEQNFPDGWVWKENEEVQQIKHILKANFMMQNINPQFTLEETKVPLLVAMAQTATPATYFAFVGFMLMMISAICLASVSRWKRA